jgi:hypothetical protein
MFLHHPKRVPDTSIFLFLSHCGGKFWKRQRIVMPEEEEKEYSSYAPVLVLLVSIFHKSYRDK